MHQCRRGIGVSAMRSLQVIPEVLTLIVGQFVVPLSSWGVVMGACVDDGVADEVLREVWVVGMTVESKLQNTCSRKLKLVAQRHYVCSDNAEIFNDEWQAAQLSRHTLEKVNTRTLHPLARLSRRRPRGHVPCCRKSSEVVQSDSINMGKQSTNPIDGPPVPGCAKRIPVVHGIAPQLSLRTELVGGDTGHEARSPMLIK
jgi:hypothetical protein